MENVVFVPSTPDSEWVCDVLPGTSPAELPVAGRRFIDYELEAARRFDIVLIEVLDWLYSDTLRNEYSDLTRTGCALFYNRGEGPQPKGLNALKGYPSPLTQNMPDNLIVLWGLCLPCHMPGYSRLEPLPPEECETTPPGIYRWVSGKWMRVLPQGFVARDVRSWFTLNMGVLNDPGEFTLPGYSAEKGVYLGRSVVLEHGTDVKAPVLLQDNSWCARNVRIDGNVIVGCRSYVGEGARLERTVVCDDTYIGPGLELTGKIVAGRRIIDPSSGVWTDIEDPGVARSIRSIEDFSPFGWLRSLWRFLQGRSKGRRR
jgi:hypothetical protein